MAKAKKISKEHRQEIAKLTVALGNLYIHQEARINDFESSALDNLGTSIDLYRRALGLPAGWSDEEEFELADESK